MNEAGIALLTSAGIMALGMSWLVGHGLHGDAVIAVPLFFQAREKAAVADIDDEAIRVDNSVAQ